MFQEEYSYEKCSEKVIRFQGCKSSREQDCCREDSQGIRGSDSRGEGSGEGMRIGFNDRYFMDALKAANEEKLRISMNTPTAPIIIEAAEGGQYLYMVLPVRLREGD